MKIHGRLAASVLAVLCSTFSMAPARAAAAAESLAYKPVMCVFDVVGQNGPAFAFAKDYALNARKWGADIKLEAYTDERLAAEDFKTGKCDGMAVTALRARAFNKFVGSIDSIGAVPSYKHLKAIIDLLAAPQSAKYMHSGEYEVAGIIPLGAAYVFVNDRSINSVEKAAGKKIAVLDYDKSQARIVQQLGAQPVSSEIINFGTKFNNGQVDIINAPAVAYQPLELYKGLGKKGGIYRFPLVQLTADLVIRTDKFPPGFGQKCREFTASKFDVAVATVDKSEASIPAQYWLDIPQQDKDKYDVMMRQARIQLTQEGFYDPKMMSILKKIRCRLNPSLGECTSSEEIH